jgi:hypothetical protein
MDLIHWVFVFIPYKFSLIQSTGLIQATADGAWLGSKLRKSKI